MSISRSAIDALEWDKFLALAASGAKTLPAREAIHSLIDSKNWAQDIASARHRQQEMAEALVLLDREYLWSPLSDLEDPSPILTDLERSSVLSVAQLVMLRRWLLAIDAWTQVPKDELTGELFRKAVASLMDPFDPLRTLQHVITPEGEISERASPKLQSLYSETRALKQELDQLLDRVMKRLSQSGILQEQFVDLRQGRYVVPVRISAQSQVDGIVQDLSASKQTVFIEPAEVAQVNGRFRRKQAEIEEEIHRILTEVSARLKPFAGETRSSILVIEHWDAVQARARMARKYGGKPLQISDDRTFRLKHTAHPLLWTSLPSERIIRNHIDLPEHVGTLLITGPNTGGKTVLLKTLGLACFCARTGFPFPATEQPRVPFFTQVFADVGDPQSIEAHLSSFSGHVFKFKEILENIREGSLVIIDELNSATDPSEGAALSRAFLESCMSRGAIVLTTTHDPILKSLGIEDRRILNASMAFDESSRTPTYRLLLGIPGLSRALETAERLGLPDDVLKLAKSYLSTQQRDFEGRIAALEREAETAVAARTEAQRERDEAVRLREEWEKKSKLSLETVLEKTNQRLKRIVEEAQDRVRQKVLELDQAKGRKGLDDVRGALNELARDSRAGVEKTLLQEIPESAQLITPRETATLPPSEYAVGEKVKVTKWKNIGEIIEIPSPGKAKISLGTLQVTLRFDEIEKHHSKNTGLHSGGKTPTRKVQVQDLPPAPPRQIDLRGQRFDDAMRALEKYLEHAFLSRAYSEVTIVHGLGTGALREGTRDLLKSIPYIKSVRDGGASGGTGATIVEFDLD